MTFREAFEGYPDEKSGKHVAGYVDYLEQKAAEKSKPPRWARNVKALGNRYLLPQWGTWSLAAMSENTDVVADWIAEIPSAVTANHCRRIIHAVYQRAAKRAKATTKLPERVPTFACETRKEKRKQGGMIYSDFAAWNVAWQKVENPVRKAYYLTNLLTGMRPGELSRTRWQDFNAKANTLAVGGAEAEGMAKAGNFIIIPVTKEIRAALDMAAKAVPDHKPSDLIFPGCGFIQHRDRAEVPVMGHKLRNTWITFALDGLGYAETITSALVGHKPKSVTQGYVLQWARHHGPAIIAAQHDISRSITAALRGKWKPSAAKASKRAA